MIKWLLILMIAMAMLPATGEHTRYIVAIVKPALWELYVELAVIWVMYLLVLGICIKRFKDG